MKAADSFLGLASRVSRDLDVEKIRRDLEAFCRERPDLSVRLQAERLITVTARRAALVGIAASLPPGWLALASIGPEMKVLAVLQARLVIALHLLYGVPMEHSRAALGLAAGAAAGAGVGAGRSLGSLAAEKLAARLAVRLGGRVVRRLVPVAGVVVGGVWNLATVRALGHFVHGRLLAVHGPPDVDGAGPAIEADGRVT